MSFDLVLKQACEGCGSLSELYGSNCKHKTLCFSCGKTMAQNRSRCNICGIPIIKLIREYNVRASTSTDKSYFIGRFCTGLPPFSKKKNVENKWTIQKDGLQGRQLTDALREKLKNKPWVLEDETGQHQYLGQLEGSQSATYYLLVMHGREFTAIPAGSWYEKCTFRCLAGPQRSTPTQLDAEKEDNILKRMTFQNRRDDDPNNDKDKGKLWKKDNSDN